MTKIQFYRLLHCAVVSISYDEKGRSLIILCIVITYIFIFTGDFHSSTWILSTATLSCCKTSFRISHIAGFVTSFICMSLVFVVKKK